ncbi:MAG: SMP-30/gluconolactonase/LRE family protein [Alphaproteobacteria bacterium]|jgi:xylono-1,5-lactonase|nr:SMP-30/gluconolactonase/LRE family protein [Alphaproteobacteria bacterium]MBT4086262.1 SMP-30/gluconolactonase/LRE family protein [Alphaproteobacteria bacterium]MBT4543879.1 SMP-30/gluconolactonase/LRE family protein [Alphaproteobacteria bacterium]MBT7745248.1 SMP-30/gluconolactonase/LRE family protein [Alphaproteobacteria bacterium]
MTTVKQVWASGALLGEGTVWIEEEQALYWVDIKGRLVHRYHPESGGQKSWPVPEEIGCLIPRKTGGFIAGLQSGLAIIDLDTGDIDKLGFPENDIPGNRINDGKADPEGRIWLGTMDNGEREKTGALYRIDADLSCHQMDKDYAITNGPAFSPDGNILYHTDTLKKTIYAFDMDEDGGISNKREHIHIADDAGYPDGMNTDAEGFLWVGHYNGWRVTRFAPDGGIDRVIEMPVGACTNIAFGGPDLETLYVSTAAKQLDAEALARQPLAGALFEVHVGVKGILPGRFAG